MVGLGDEQRPYALTHAPISVVPVPFPRGSFQKAQAAMTIFNKLIDRVSQDGEYLQKTLGPAAEYDDFTASVPCQSYVSSNSCIAGYSLLDCNIMLPLEF